MAVVTYDGLLERIISFIFTKCHSLSAQNMHGKFVAPHFFKILTYLSCGQKIVTVPLEIYMFELNELLFTVKIIHQSNCNKKKIVNHTNNNG